MKKSTPSAELEMSNICVLNVGYAQTQHQWGGTDLSSPFARIYYVKAGRAILHLPDQDLELEPGYMYLLPRFLPHSYVCDPGFQFYYMFVYMRYGEQQGLFESHTLPYRVKANEGTDLLFTNFCQMYPQLSLPYKSAIEFDEHPAYRDYAHRYMEMERYEKMQLQGLVWIVLSYFMKHASMHAGDIDPRVQRVCNYVKEHIIETPTLDQMSNIANVAKSHLSRLFNEAFGVSPLQYVIRSKVQYAQTLLLTSNRTVREIAFAVGMMDVSYFVRMFKKNIGFTPMDYRNSLKY